METATGPAISALCSAATGRISGNTGSDKLLQTYGNLCDVPGEYHSSAMLVMPTHASVHCMPLPVVAHQRNKYYVIFQNGYRHLRQRNVYFEDFV